MKLKLKKILSVILIVAQASTVLTGCGNGGGSFFDIFKKNFTVSFALAEDASEFDIEETSLPESVTVKKGTLIGELPASNRTSGIFMGYSYDSKGLKPAPDDAEIIENLTLYPMFDSPEGMTNVFDMNFVSGTDVSSDYSIEVSAYGLSPEELKQILKVKDLTTGDEEMPYIIEENTDAALSGMVPEKLVFYVRNLIDLNREEPETDVMGRLYSMGLDMDTVYRLVLIYAPEEREAFYKDQAGKTGDAQLEESVLSEMAEIGSYTENELKEIYGLSGDDSLERYWREDAGLSIEEVLRLSDIVKANSTFRETSRYTIRPSEEGWAEGDLFQAEILNTERLRFVFGEEICSQYITYYNFTVGCEEKKNLAVGGDVIFIPANEVSGVTLGSLFEISVDGDGNSVTTEREIKGTLEYKGPEALTEGSVIAVYDGTLNVDRSVDGEVGYFEITADKGSGKFDYQSADLKEVIALPRIIPVKSERRSGDSAAVIPYAELKFDKELRDVLGFSEEETIKEGDYLAFYVGNLDDRSSIDSSEGIEFEGYAKVLSVSGDGGNYTVEFADAPVEEVVSSVNLYMKTGEVAPELSEIDEEEIKQSMLEEIERSNLVDEASDYLCTAILSDEADLEKYKNRDKLEQMQFKTADGEEITFEEVRRLADGGEKVKVDDVNVAFVISGALQHFEGKAGLRAEVTVSLKITISLGEAGNIEITPMVVFEQEVLISPAINVKGKWGYALGFIPYLAYIDIDPTFECGTYTGIGLNVTIMTKGAEDENQGEFADMVKEYNDNAGDGKYKREDTVKNLIKSGDSLKKLADLKKAAGSGAGAQWEGGQKNEEGGLMENSSPGVGGSLPDKYSAMLGNDAEYIDLVNKEIGTFATPVDPFHLVEFSIGAYFVVSFKLNAMIGTGISYENAKQFTYHVRKYVFARGEDEKYSSQADLATPHFRADFYAFGMIGIRVGIRIDVRLGIISTKLASIGVTAELGLYAEVYGFLYVWYEWTSGQGSTSGAMGSLYFEVGIYLEINFVAQLGEGRFSKEISLYENTWPLVKLGAEAVPLDFTIEKNDDSLDIEYEKGKSSVKMPDDLYKINMMDMKSGEVSEEEMDSAQSCGEGTSFTTRGRTYTQYDEEHFIIECHDTDEDGERLDTCSFVYLPATNEVLVKPASAVTKEIWGEVTFTYKNSTFGFNTMKIRRTVKLHWEGTPAAATVEYYVEKEPGSGEYELKEEGEFDGFNGIEYDIIVDEDFTYKYDGYRLAKAEFEDVSVLREKYNELLEEYNRQVKAYYSTGKNRAEIEEMKNNLDAAFDNLNNYGQNIYDTIEKGEGTLYFLMGAEETVVKIYYDHIASDVTWRVWGDPNMAGEMGTLLGYGRKENVAMGEKIASALSDADELLKKYEDFVLIDRKETAEDTANAEFKEFDENSVMEDKSVVVDYYVKAKTYNLSWALDDNKIKTEEVGAYYRIPLSAPDTDAEDGYYILYWDTSDMSKDLALPYYVPDILTEGYKYVMPARDAVITAKLQPQKYRISWYFEDRLLASTYAEYGSVIRNNPWFPRNINRNLTDKWYLETAEGLVELEDSMTVPAGDIKLQVVYEPVSYTATFMDGDTLVEKVDMEGRRIVTTPDYENTTRSGQGYGLKWHFHAPEGSGMSDEQYDPGQNVVLPYMDVVFTADWYCSSHRWDGGSVTKAASCTEDGTRTFTCLNCGSTYTESIPVTGHDWDEGVVTKKAGCESEGVVTFTCRNGGETYTESIPATGHDWDEGAVTKKAGCESEGVVTFTCKNCGETYTESIPATGHKWDDGVVTFEGNCSREKEITYTCSECGETRVEKVKGSGHNWDSGVVTTEADCEHDGVMTYTCRDCKATYTEIIPATGHSWDSGKITIHADCVHDEEITYTCKNCGEKKTEKGKSATGLHTYGNPVYTWGSNYESCTGVKICTVCGHEISETTVDITCEITRPLNGTVPGIKTYTATFTSENGFTTHTKDVEFIHDENLYYNGYPAEEGDDNWYTSSIVAVSDGVIRFKLTDSITDIPVDALLLDCIFLRVFDGSTYEQIYEYIPSFDEEMTFAEIEPGREYDISYELSDDFEGDKNDYIAPPSKIVFYRD